jgi:hypothetical protein
MQWLIPVTMGLWAIWTWSQEREQERLTRRARLAALYVNPFMSACEDLQSRIYSILELGGLRTLRKRYPDGAYAEEILYLSTVFRMGSGSITLQPLLSGPCRDSPCGSSAGCIRHHQRRLPGRAIQLLPS